MRPLEKVSDYLWELPASYKPGMRVPGRIYATEKMLDHIVGDNCLERVKSQGRQEWLGPRAEHVDLIEAQRRSRTRMISLGLKFFSPIADSAR